MAMDKDKKPIAFTRADGLRIRKAVQDYERGFQNDLPLRARYPVGGGGSSGVRIAKTAAGGIAAMSGTTPGTATDVVLYNFDGTVLTAVSGTITVKNNFTSAVGATRWIQVVKVQGSWFVASEDCP